MATTQRQVRIKGTGKIYDGRIVTVVSDGHDRRYCRNCVTVLIDVSPEQDGSKMAEYILLEHEWEPVR